MMQNEKVDYFLFTLSPFSYLAGNRLEEVAKKRGIEVAYRPFNLFKVFGETGTPLPKDRHPSRQAYRLQEIQRIADFEGLPITVHPAHWPTDPLPSCLAIIAAAESGEGDVGGLVHSILKACWAEEKDISRREVVAACLEANGFPGSIADADQSKAREVFDRNTDEALSRGVFGAPSYLVGEQVFWGQDRLPHLDAWLGRNSAG